MFERIWLLGRGFACALTLLLCVLVGAQDTSESKTKGKKEKEPADPPRTTLYMNQLRAAFAAWDRNKDDHVDKGELAIAFYGAGAKPFDDKETKGKKTDKDEGKPASKKDETGSEKDRPGKTADYSKRADYQFLVQVDRDRDDRISRDEFMEWAREYAMQVRDQAEAQQKAAQLQKQLSNPKAKNKKSLETQLKKQQQQLNKLQGQLKRYQQVQKSLK